MMTFLVRLRLEFVLEQNTDQRRKGVEPNTKQVYGTTLVSLGYFGYSGYVKNENTPNTR